MTPERRRRGIPPEKGPDDVWHNIIIISFMIYPAAGIIAVLRSLWR